MSSSFLPERTCCFSPSLAATIGLEEAVMLQSLQEVQFHHAADSGGGLLWIHLSEPEVRRLLPFWSALDIQRVSKSLVDKGLLLVDSPPFTQVMHLHFALNMKAPAYSGTPRAQATTGSSHIAPHWQPEEAILQQIDQHGIPRNFAMQLLPEFISYWTARGEATYAWGNKFLRQVVRTWREQEAMQNNALDPIERRWQPSEDALEILHRTGIAPQFIEDAIAEFVLYWRERGEATTTWNSKFIAHVKRQWARYNASLQHDSEPHRIAANWQPSNDVYDILRLANIDQQFAEGLIKEFVLCWRDSKQLQPSWNTKFLQHVKFHWAKQHQLPEQQAGNYAQRGRPHRGSETATKSA
ncbi:MAG: DnaT-like ssDNA-binding domain-containing protein, partial [Pseudomonadales bacterium]